MMDKRELLEKYRSMYRDGYITKAQYKEKKAAFKEAMKAEKEPMDRKKKIIIGGAAAIIVVAAAILIAVLIPKAEMEVEVIDEKTGEYMAVNVPKDFEFTVEGASDVEVKDIHGEDAGCRISDGDGALSVKAPEGGYEKGDIYKVKLGKGESFTNEELRDVRSLLFVIESKNRNVVEYTDKVEQLKDDEATLDGDRLTLDGTYSNGDIIAVDANGDGAEEIYELKDVKNEQGSTDAGFAEPDADPEDIYEELDIFYYGYMDFSEVEIDEEAFRGVINETGIMDAFIDEAYAAKVANIEVNVKDCGKDFFQFGIILTDPRDENRTLTLDLTARNKVLVSVDDDAICVDTALTIENGLGFEVKGSDSKSTEAGIQEALKNYKGNKGGKAEESEYEVPLVPLRMPFGPVLAIGDLGLVAEAGYSAQFNADIDTEITLKTGLVFDRKKIKIADIHADVTGDAEASMRVQGALSAFAGGYLKLGVKVPVIAQIDISGKFGPYFDAEGCFIVDGIPKDIKADGYYDIEMGMMGKADIGIEALKIFNKDFDLLEVKKPMYELSCTRKLIRTDIKDSYTLDDEGVYIGKINAVYRDVIDNKVKTGRIKDCEMTLDGKEVKLEDGMLKGDFKEGKHTIGLKWERKGQKFSAEVETEFTDFDPWGYFSKKNYAGKYESEIDIPYSTEGMYGGVEGAGGYYSEALGCDLLMAVITEEDFMCVGLGGTARNVIGLEENIDIYDLADALNTNAEFLSDPYSGSRWELMVEGYTIVIPGRTVHPDDLMTITKPASEFI